MLKIKDNVDLKELEKFEIIYIDDKESSYFGCCEYYGDNISLFINNAKVISIKVYTDKTLFNIDILYALIKADLVEKVEG